MAAKMRQNITLDPDVFDEFCHYAGLKGIKISTWINQRMKEFVEEEKGSGRKKKGSYPVTGFSPQMKGWIYYARVND